MKKLTILFLLISFCASAQILKEPKGVMWYWEYPNPNCKDCPIVIFLHGSGENSDTPNLSLVQRNGTPKLLKYAGLSYLDGFTLIVPQQVKGKGFMGQPQDPDITKFLIYIRETYLTNEIYLTGLSQGGDGVWYGSYLGTQKLIKGAVPVSCKGDYNLAKVTEQRGIKVWGIHGSSDNTVPVSDGKRPINGMLSIGGKPKWILINGGAHNSSTWDVAFSLNDRPELGGTTIYKWFLTLVTPKPVELPGLYLDGEFCGTDSCRVDNHLITLKK